jgi:hypothetical protein
VGSRFIIPLCESGSDVAVLDRLIQNILKLSLDLSGDSCNPLFGLLRPVLIMAYLAFEFLDPAAGCL